MGFRFPILVRSRVEEFRRGRQRQTDEEFWSQCGLPDTPRARQIALAVRRAVANVGLVDSQFISLEDSYPGTLEVLPIWDSIDWLSFVFELEKELAEKVIQDAALTKMMYSKETVSVREMVEIVYAQLCKRDVPVAKA
jgi:hypothetical protein